MKPIEMASDEEIRYWKSIAESHKGRYVEGSLGELGHVEIPYRRWHIHVGSSIVCRHDSSEHLAVSTIIVARYLTLDHLSFRLVTEQNVLFVRLRKTLGLQDIVVGHDDFDETFLVKGNNPEKIGALFSRSSLSSSLVQIAKSQSQDEPFSYTATPSRDELGKAFEGRLFNLELQLSGEADDPSKRFSTALEIVKGTLDGLAEYGSADEVDFYGA